jgi:hypothetical protein
MQILANHIETEIEMRGLSAVYEPELSRVWPKNCKKRQGQIELFAKKHGWQVRHYKDGFVAIFVKELPSV